jgi:hypothetical protein
MTTPIPRTRLLHEFHPRARYHIGEADTRAALYVGVDTELAAVRFHYCPETAAIYQLDPPLPAFNIHTLRNVTLVVSHNAAVDRPRLERELPILARFPWACSMTDIPWLARGFSSATLECLLIKHCREYYDARRVLMDCYIGIHLLATPLTTGERPLAFLLSAAIDSAPAPKSP